MRCSKCTGPYNTQCLTCASNLSVLLSPYTGYCECKIGFYALPASGDCQGIYIFKQINLACHSSCESCKGLNEYDCLDCKSSIMKYDPVTYSCTCPTKHYNTPNGNCLRIYILIYRYIYIYIFE